MGMDKSGTFSFGASFADITGWVVRSGFPETILSGNGMSMNVDGTISVTANLTMSSGGGYALRITKNGSAVGSEYTTNSFTTPPFAVAAGDVIRIQGKVTSLTQGVSGGYVQTTVS